jgi:hypothetical protein
MGNDRDVPRHRRVLVVASVPPPKAWLRAELRDAGEDPILKVVAPASKVTFGQWLANEEDYAREQAGRIAEETASAVPGGRVAEAEAGDTDPLLAATDALSTFDADEILFVVPPDADANWLEASAAETAAERLRRPVRVVIAPDPRTTRP